MRSISTMRGDGGETSLAGGIRVSKGSAASRDLRDDRRVELGARVCAFDLRGRRDGRAHQERSSRICSRSGRRSPRRPRVPKPPDRHRSCAGRSADAEVHRIEAIEGMLADWSIPGEHRAAAAYDVARTICRRAERALVRLQESGAAIQPAILRLCEPAV